AEQGGETWLVQGERGAIVSDTVVNGQRVFYARDGAVTTCNETTPHYHFEARDIKMVSKSILVIRPAVLYIGDVPVMWLPFIFTDPRGGRRSGLLTPRFGVAELLRNSPTYRRTIENAGYYWNLNDYVDAQTWVDWRSGARERAGDPGYFRVNGETRYRILDRFLQGQLSAFQEWFRDGRRNVGVTARHEQAFNQNRRVSANINWVQSTQLRQQNAFNAAQALGTIRSGVNFSDKYGPLSLQAGGGSTQYPGRPQIDLAFPTVSLSAQTINVTPWLDWTPVLSFDTQQSFKIDQGVQFNQVYGVNDRGQLDSTALRPSRRTTTARFDTPLKIFDFNWQNNFSFNEEVQDFPATRVVYGDITDSTSKETRVFPQTFSSNLNWTTAFSLPRFFQGSWNVSPTVSLSNVDSRFGLLVRTEQSGGRWVTQRLRPSYGVSAAPTFYAFAPGAGPVERFRHSINPVLSYSYSPTANVSDEFLRAIGARKQGYLGSLVQNRVTLQLATNLEAKLRARRPAPDAAGRDSLPAASAAAAGAAADTERADTTRLATGAGATAGVLPTAGGSANTDGRKVRVLSLTFTSLSYDFARADSTGRGFIDRNFGYSLRSDLLPGFDFNTNYDLFLGDPQSDTATFKPYRTSTNVTFSLDRNSTVFGAVARLFGRRIAPRAEQGGGEVTPGGQGGEAGDAFFNQQTLAQQASGNFPRQSQFEIPTQDWRISLTYTEARQRPDLRGPIFTLDPTVRCEALRQAQQLGQYEICRLQSQAAPPPGQLLPTTTLGGPIFLSPPQRSITANSAFHITQKWAAQWTTTYDVARSSFASNQLNLQRELHDWRATFGVTQAPNGNFAFTFFISLKAEPDLKFNYNRQSFPRIGQSAR
ncbi:MAG TPA: putative LPS assembly protein LptD, partial [Gemmatirosa sp.]|nr:putative LPS assembly protein LptD [Gemmatirosa sp.]